MFLLELATWLSMFVKIYVVSLPLVIVGYGKTWKVVRLISTKVACDVKWPTTPLMCRKRAIWVASASQTTAEKTWMNVVPFFLTPTQLDRESNLNN